MNRVAAILDRLGRAVMENVEETGRILLLFLSVLAWMFSNQSVYGGFAIRFEDEDLKYLLTTTPIPK